jgi:hypothetical protein
MTQKVDKLIKAALEWFEAYENYAKTPDDSHVFERFATNIKLLTAIRDYKGK